jgi:acyl-[acyl-carrier-protein] desaturase
MASLDVYAGSELKLLLPLDKCWQPTDLLPDLGGADWNDRLVELRRGAATLPDHLLVTLVANMITEEALPSYHAWLSNLEDGFDKTGVADNGMAKWIRGWVAEEKRHGDVLARYLYLSGRVDMRAVERTVHHLLRNGFDPLTENSAIQGFIYTSFQERATFVAHANTGRAAREAGDELLAKLCENVAGDEARHERAYERFVAHLFEKAPDQTMICLAAMLRKTIVMPSKRMSDGSETNLYDYFSAITQRNGIYTTHDYVRIMEHLVRLWKIDKIAVTTPEGREAQDYVAALPERYNRLADRAEARKAKPKHMPLSWLYGRTVE